MKRLIALLLALALGAAGAWVVADRLESPDQMAARAAPPAPVPVVATLTRGYLNGAMTLSSVAAYEQTVVVPPPSALTGVVTASQVGAGATLGSGAVLLRANGRPLFVLGGAFALYRDIRRGDSGDDVTAVQEGLAAAGFPIGRDRAGTFGRGTQAALRAMYEAAGYEPPEVPVAVVTPAAGGATDGAPAPTADGSAVPGSVASTPATPDASGPCVLQTEVMMVATLPATVVSVAPVGAPIDGEAALATLGAGGVVLTATLPAGSVGALVVGATAVLTDDAGAPGSAVVAAISPAATGDDVVVVLAPTGAVTPGTSYVLTVDNPAAEPGDSLLAPVAAVVSRGGRSYVYVRDGSVFGEVEVEVTGSVGAVAAIEPAGAEPAGAAASAPPGLGAGTEVRVG